MITDDIREQLTLDRIEQLHEKVARHTRLGLTNHCAARRCRDRWPCFHRREAITELGAHGISPRSPR